MNNWRIFQKNQPPHEGINRLPEPPSWRQFDSKGDEHKAATFQPREKDIDAVNIALYLRRPLLVTGEPGSGKTSLVYAVARQLKLGQVLRWNITTRTTLQDGLYRYDAIARLQDAQMQQAQGKSTSETEDIGKYIALGPLGTAFLPSDTPRPLLIDEIDKSDIDLPNDLLHIFEEGSYEIDELLRWQQEQEKQQQAVTVRTAYTDGNERATIKGGRVCCTQFPFVVMTSNGERDFPPAFLRRCIRLDMGKPTQEELEAIVEAHLQGLGEEKRQQAHRIIAQFVEKRERQQVATDQLLNAVYLLTRDRVPADKQEQLQEVLLRAINER
jgi:MoxR-like ATPase